MRFSTIIAAVLPIAAVFAQGNNHVVKVGDNGGLTFEPNNIQVANGDSVSFQFLTKNHTVTQSTFATPCTALAGGVDSGFQFVPPNSTTFMQWTFTVNNASAPLWFYCRQANHCQSGMVFAINPSADKTFASYQAKAMSSTSNATSSAPASSGTASAPGVATIAASSGSSATTSPSPSASTTSDNSGAGAIRAGSAAGLLLTGVGIAASFLL